MGVIFSTRHGRVLVGVTAVVAVLVTIDGVRWSGVVDIFRAAVLRHSHLSGGPVGLVLIQVCGVAVGAAVVRRD